MYPPLVPLYHLCAGVGFGGRRGDEGLQGTSSNDKHCHHLTAAFDSGSRDDDDVADSVADRRSLWTPITARTGMLDTIQKPGNMNPNSSSSSSSPHRPLHFFRREDHFGVAAHRSPHAMRHEDNVGKVRKSRQQEQQQQQQRNRSHTTDENDMVGRWECTSSEELTSAAEALVAHQATLTAAASAYRTPAAMTGISQKKRQVGPQNIVGVPVTTNAPAARTEGTGGADRGRVVGASRSLKIQSMRSNHAGLNNIGDQPSTSTRPAPSSSTIRHNAFDPLKPKILEDGTPFLSGKGRGQKRLRADESGFQSRRRLLRRTRSCEGMVENKHDDWVDSGQDLPSPRGQRERTTHQVCLGSLGE